jgi:hypothetical protein
LAKDAPGADSCVDKKGKPLNDCALNRQRNVLMNPGFYLNLAMDKVKSSVASYTPRVQIGMKAFNSASKIITTEVSKELTAASKTPATTNADLTEIEDAGLARLFELGDTATIAEWDVFLAIKKAIEKEGEPDRLIAVRETYGDDITDEAGESTDGGIVKLNEAIAKGIVDAEANKDEWHTKLVSHYNEHVAVITTHCRLLSERMKTVEKAALAKQQKMADKRINAEKKAEAAQLQAEKKAESQRRKEEDGPPPPKKRVQAMKCANPVCMPQQNDDYGLTKCAKKYCNLYFCGICEQIKIQHEGICQAK